MSTKNPKSNSAAPTDHNQPPIFAAFPEPQGWAVGWDTSELTPAPKKSSAPKSKQTRSN